MPVNSIKGFGIIADDLTGAMDAGAGFLGIGLHPFIQFGSKSPLDSSVIVISTDSRDADPETAYKKVRRQAHQLAGLHVYKKIDSTLRGNIGKELIAVMDALRFEKAVVCPAFPANERTVVDGKLMIGSIPINETSFAKDPGYPITEASIPTLLHKQIGLPVGIIRLEEVSKGPNNVFQKIKNSEQKVIVVDATEEKHLRCIAQAVSMSAGAWLPCGSGGLARELPLAFGYRPVAEKPYGSAGLARELPLAFGYRPVAEKPYGSAGLAKELPQAFGYKPVAEKPFVLTVSTKPVLAVVGSRNYTSMKQIKTAEMCLSIHVISIEPDKFVDGEGKLTGLRALIKEVADFINCGKSVLITTALSRYVPALKESSARLLARIVARTVNRWEMAGLFLTGGDIARETCSALGVTGIKILKELEPGVILGETMGRVRGDIRIITKAGGFGGDKTIVDAISYLRGGER